MVLFGKRKLHSYSHLRTFYDSFAAEKWRGKPMNPYESPNAEQPSTPRQRKPNAARDWGIGAAIFVALAVFMLLSSLIEFWFFFNPS